MKLKLHKILFLAHCLHYYYSVHEKKIKNTALDIKSNFKIKADSTQLFNEPFRPQVHFTPEKNG
jgi:fructan beta-fructosidase